MNAGGGSPAAKEEGDFWFVPFMVACAVIFYVAWIVLEPREETQAPGPVQAAAHQDTSSVVPPLEKE